MVVLSNRISAVPLQKSVLHPLAEHIGFGLCFEFVVRLDTVAAVVLVEVGLVEETEFVARLVVWHLAPHHQFVEVAARNAEIGGSLRRRK